MEIWSWSIVDKAAPPEIKKSTHFMSQYRFSPTGVFEQDDMDNWLQVTQAGRSIIGRRFPLNYQMNLGSEVVDTRLRGRISNRWSDCNQLGIYQQWARLLEAESWADLQR